MINSPAMRRTTRTTYTHIKTYQHPPLSLLKLAFKQMIPIIERQVENLSRKIKVNVRPIKKMGNLCEKVVLVQGNVE